MNYDDAIKRFERIISLYPPLRPGRVRNQTTGRLEDGMLGPPESDLHEWKAKAQSALYAVFPEGHSHREMWKNVNGTSYPSLARYLGVMRAASSDLRDGYFATLVDGIRTEDALGVVEQAGELLGSHYRAGAMAIAGGAMEMHLKHLCVRYAATWAGAGSINKYATGLNSVRGANPGMAISPADVTEALSLGQERNEAAHEPAKYNETKTDDHVARKIEAVKALILRTQ